jgi:hypothetical protein
MYTYVMIEQQHPDCHTCGTCRGPLSCWRCDWPEVYAEKLALLDAQPSARIDNYGRIERFSAYFKSGPGYRLVGFDYPPSPEKWAKLLEDIMKIKGCG